MKNKNVKNEETHEIGERMFKDSAFQMRHFYGNWKGHRLFEYVRDMRFYFNQEPGKQMTLVRAAYELCTPSLYESKTVSEDDATMILQSTDMESILRKHLQNAREISEKRKLVISKNEFIALMIHEIPRLQEGFMEIGPHFYGKGHIIKNPNNDYWNGSWDNAVKRTELR